MYLNGLAFRGCRGCDRCAGAGECVLDDELTPVIAELHEATGWVLASPIYYDSVSVTVDVTVGTEAATWSGIKALYR